MLTVIRLFVLAFVLLLVPFKLFARGLDYVVTRLARLAFKLARIDE